LPALEDSDPEEAEEFSAAAQTRSGLRAAPPVDSD